MPGLVRKLMTEGPKPVWIRYLLILGAVTLLTRLGLDSRFATTSFFYCLVPYVVGIILYLFVPQPQGSSRGRRMGRHFLAVIIVMLASSAIIFEGFICVLFAAPIYILFALLSFEVWPVYKPDSYKKKKSDVFKVSIVPLAVIVMSIEGLTDTTSFPREETITRTQILNLTPTQIQANLARPIHLEEGRSKFLSIFPLPDRVEAPAFAQGQTHTAYFTYRRWGFTNVHRGETELHIKTVEPLLVETEVTKNTSYFSHYLTIHGTRIEMTPQADGTTEVSLTIRYRRDLDPAWYFGPLQKRAISESADYLLANIIGKTDKETDETT